MYQQTLSCFHLIMRILLKLSIFLLCYFPPPIATEFELCNPGVSTVVYKFSGENCPFGVLFEQPVIAHCMTSTSGLGTFFSDLCSEENYTVSETDSPHKIHLSFRPETEQIDPDASCSGDGPKKCNNATIVYATNVTLTEPDRDDPCDADTVDTNLTEEEEGRRLDVRVFNQTERLFKFIVGLYTDSDPKGPHFRVVKLLKQCFKILGLYSDNDFIPRQFTNDTLNAFLFLLRDSDLSNFIDVSVEKYETVMATLQQCEQMSGSPFRLHGSKCKTCSTAHTIEKNESSLNYAENEFSFMWGRYDIPVHATWGVLSFVHGLCYGTFRLNVNFHHLFQRVTESLFTQEIQYRWYRPPMLPFEDIWDNMFSAPVRSTMANLDAYIHAAYHDTPFLHRLDLPPFVEVANASVAGSSGQGTQVPPGGPKRRKRSITNLTMTLDHGLAGAGWCFQSKEDLIATTKAYIDMRCPDKKKAFDELQELIKDPIPENNNGTVTDGADKNNTETADADGANQNNTDMIYVDADGEGANKNNTDTVDADAVGANKTET